MVLWDLRSVFIGCLRKIGECNIFAVHCQITFASMRVCLRHSGRLPVSGPWTAQAHAVSRAQTTRRNPHSGHSALGIAGPSYARGSKLVWEMAIPGIDGTASNSTGHAARNS